MKALPQNVSVEQEVLSCIFADNDNISNVIGFLKDTDFYDTKHKYIYSRMQKCFQNNTPIEPVTIYSTLNEDMIKVVSITYLSQLAASGLKSKDIMAYAKIIKELSNKRKVIKSCMEAAEKAYQNESTVIDIIDNLQNNFLDFNNINKEGTLDSYKFMESTLTMIENSYRSNGHVTGIETGYKKLDTALNGLNKKDLVIIAARPSMGKTALVMNLIGNINPFSNVLMFELEMAKEKLGVRLLAQKSLKNASDLSKGKLNEQDFILISNKASNIANNKNIFINCEAGLTLSEIRAEVKKIKLKHGLDIVVVDHIGKIKPSNLKASRNEQIGEITDSLKNMAKDLDVCVIALCQLNRECERRSDKRPQLSDLRDSGNIEQDADSIVFIYRDDYYAEREGRDSENPNSMELIIAKNRDGEIGIVELFYKSEYQVITDKYQ